MNWLTLDGRAPLILAHRGASGLRPEHTLDGYALGLAQQADVIEPDLVPSADGILFARHEPALARSSDVAARPAFASRGRDGDWWSVDLSAAEIDQLRARQPFPGRGVEHDDRHAIPRFSAVLDWAASAAHERQRDVILYPEIKHPNEFAARGLDPVPMFVEVARAIPSSVQVWVQCFEAEPLRRVCEATGLPCALLLDSEDDWSLAITAHGEWLSRLGVNKKMLSRALLDQAHARGLAVDAWTFRDDAVGQGYASIDAELTAALRLGIDGAFCDFPATAVAVRQRLASLAAS